MKRIYAYFFFRFNLLGRKSHSSDWLRTPNVDLYIPLFNDFSRIGKLILFQLVFILIFILTSIIKYEFRMAWDAAAVSIFMHCRVSLNSVCE